MSSLTAFDSLLEQIQGIQDEVSIQDYHAFVYWFIDTVFGLEKKQILDSLCDGTHDKCIDAVIIDDREKHVVIVQSKFEHAGGIVQISEGEIKEFSAVKDYLKSRRALEAATPNANQATKRLLNCAFDLIHNKRYTWELAFITSHKQSPTLEGLIHQTLGFKANEFSVYDFDRIIMLLKDRLRDFTPLIAPYSLPYNGKDSAIVRTIPNRSWVISVPIDEIRLLVNKHQDKLFRKNVRNFLGHSITNKGMQDTLKNEQSNFWYYNNGITILCDEGFLNVEDHYIRLTNPQIVNGCQTARSLEKFGGELNGDVMVRVIESKSHAFINSITLYQNSSNPVKMRDFKSNDPIQVRLKHELARKGYYYEIKRGEEYSAYKAKYRSAVETFSKTEEYGTLNNELIAKLLAAIKLNPSIAASKGSEMFFDDKDGIYTTLFPQTISTFDCLAPYFLFWSIKQSYSGDGPYHKLSKSWPFKNRASFFVLAFIYEAMKNNKNWAKDIVLFTENNPDDQYQKRLGKPIEKVINGFFNVIYSGWRTSKDKDDYNAYLTNLNAFLDIKTRKAEKVRELKLKTQNLFSELQKDR